MSDLTQKTPEELTLRQRTLEGEIQASEDEMHAMQNELNAIYREQDRRRG